MKNKEQKREREKKDRWDRQKELQASNEKWANWKGNKLQKKKKKSTRVKLRGNVNGQCGFEWEKKMCSKEKVRKSKHEPSKRSSYEP